MARSRRAVLEYRNYLLPADFPLLLLEGPEWHISPLPSQRLHFHNCLEIGICHSDSGIMIMGEKEVSFRAGDITVVGQNVPHTTWSSPGTYSLWSYLYVDPNAMLGSSAVNLLPDPRGYHEIVLNGHFLLQPETCPWASPLIHGLIHEYQEKALGYPLYIRSLLQALVLNLLRLHAEDRTAPVISRTLITISPALDFIQTHSAQDFPMDCLAEVCHLSPTHFRRQFLSLMGISPLAYLHQVRIYNSCSLLRTTGLGIAEIAAQVGYASLSVFNRHFLEIIGSTPSTWRKTGPDASLRPALITATGWTKAETDEEISHSSEQ